MKPFYMLAGSSQNTRQSEPSKLRLLLALDNKFESLAAIALLSFLLHNKVELIVVVTPETTQLLELVKIATLLETPLQQVKIPDNAPCNVLQQDTRPYFYCIEAIEQVCHGSLASDPGRYLYLDSDTLCVRDVGELVALTLGNDRPLAACSHGRPMVDRELILDLASPYHYFNAGVILFDSEPLACHISSRRVVDYYITNRALCRFREQCVLNALLRDKVLYLPNNYNYLSWMRPRASENPWHQLTNNPMAYYLGYVREELAIAHLSAGAIPDRLRPKSLEPLDHYWLKLASAANSLKAGVEVLLTNDMSFEVFQRQNDSRY